MLNPNYPLDNPIGLMAVNPPEAPLQSRYVVIGVKWALGASKCVTRRATTPLLLHNLTNTIEYKGNINSFYVSEIIFEADPCKIIWLLHCMHKWSAVDHMAHYTTRLEEGCMLEF